MFPKEKYDFNLSFIDNYERLLINYGSFLQIPKKGEDYDSLDFNVFPNIYQDIEFQSYIESKLFDENEKPTQRYFDVTLIEYERFIEIPNYYGYKISTYGRVLSPFHNKIMSPRKVADGYRQAHLVFNKKSLSGKYQTLMKLAFYPNTIFKFMNHIDGIRYNNCIWNLHPCSRKYNNRFGNIHELKKAIFSDKNRIANHISKLAEKGKTRPCVAISKSSGEVLKFKSVGEAARYIRNGTHFRAAKSIILQCCNKHNYSAYGYYYMDLKDYELLKNEQGV